MKPTDFYKKEYISGLTKSKKKGFTGIGANFLFYNGLYDMEYLNNEAPPTDWEIANLQLLNLRYNFAIDSKLSAWVNKNSNTLMHLGDSSLNSQFTLEQGLQLIEETFSNYVAATNKTVDTAKVLSQRINKNTNNLNDYYIALQKLKDVQNIINTNDGFINGSKFQNTAKQINDSIKLLEQDLQDANNGIYHSDNQKYFSFEKNKDDVRSIFGLGRRIKGRVFESQLNNFILQLPIILDDKGKNKTGVVDLGNVEIKAFDIFGGEKYGKGYDNRTFEARTDTLLLDLTKAITVHCMVDGKETDLKLEDFLAKCNNKQENIIISNAELDSLMNSSAFLGGIQSKSGFNQNPISNFKVSPIEATALAGLSNVHAKSLAFMIYWYSHGHTKANHPAYNAWFNYCISHDLTRIIGKGNTLLAIRDRIVPTVDYFYEQWINYGKFIKAIRPISMASWGTKMTEVNLSKAKVF